MTLETDLLDCLRGVIARPCKSEELIRELTQMAAHNSAWSKASWEQWESALERLIKRGEIVRIGQTLWLPVAAQKSKPKQGELF